MANFFRSVGVFIWLATLGALLLGVCFVLLVGDPLEWATRYMMRVYPGSDVYNAFEAPDYIIHQTVYIFNYTNTERFLQGKDAKLRVEEIGPFVFQEVSVGLNTSIDYDKELLRFVPNSSLVYQLHLSVGRLEEIRIVAPNLVMIVMGTLGADLLPSWSNTMVSLVMRSLGCAPFLTLTADELLWGYKDPLVDLAGFYFPGWIDFSVVGILQMFYSAKPKPVQVEIAGERKFSINNVEGSPGLRQQGYLGPGTGNPCNVLRGAYQGYLISPHFPRNQVMGLYKMQGCRVFPFVYTSEATSEYGVPYYRYSMKEDAYSMSGEYACPCKNAVCPVEGLVDISNCYYGFPAYTSTPHYYMADPTLLEPLEGLDPNPERAESHIDFDPITGAPIDILSTMQTSLRVNISPYNPVMKAFGSIKYLPIMWMRMSTPYGPSEQALSSLRLLHVYGPRILAAVQVAVAAVGAALVAVGVSTALRIRAHNKRRSIREEEKRIAAEKMRERPAHNLRAVLMAMWFVTALRKRETRTAARLDDDEDDSQLTRLTQLLDERIAIHK